MLPFWHGGSASFLWDELGTFYQLVLVDVAWAVGEGMCCANVLFSTLVLGLTPVILPVFVGVFPRHTPIHASDYQILK
jgi:hypothetical protein